MPEQFRIHLGPNHLNRMDEILNLGCSRGDPWKWRVNRRSRGPMLSRLWLAELAPTQASSVAHHGYGDGVAASSWLHPAMVVWPRPRSHTAFLVAENRASSQQMPFATAEINVSISTSSRAVHFDNTFLCCRQPNPVSSSHKDSNAYLRSQN